MSGTYSRIIKLLSICLYICNLSLANAYYEQYPENPTHSIFDNFSLDEHPYVKIGAGVIHPSRVRGVFPLINTTLVHDTIIDYKFKTYPLYNIGIGNKFNDWVKADINVQYTRNEVKGTNTATIIDYNSKLKLRTLSVIANGYCTLPINKTFVPYITAGLGVNNYFAFDLVVSSPATGKSVKIKKDPTQFLWNIGAGTEINFNNRYGMDFEYRYVSNFGKYKIGTHVGRLTSHQGLVSLVYRPS